MSNIATKKKRKTEHRAAELQPYLTVIQQTSCMQHF